MTAAASIRARSGGRRGEGRARIMLLLGQVAFGIGLLAAWQLASGPIINPLFFSSPLEVFGRVGELIRTNEILPHIQTTWTEFALGYPVGAALGITAGLSLGLLPSVAPVVQPYILAVYSIPKIALAPLFVMVFGIGMESKIAVVAMSVFFFVFLNSFHGAKSIDPELVNLARVMGASRRQIALRIMLPSALPAILVGLRGSVPYGMIGAIVGEYIASSQGLGWFIRQAGTQLNAPGIFSGVLILMATTLVLLAVVSFVEGRIVRWRPRAEARVSL